MGRLDRFLFGLHVFIGAGAMLGGLAAVLDPSSPLGMPADSLKRSPFKDFLIPGLILLVVLGLGNLASAAVFLMKKRWRGYYSLVAGGILMVWIIVQCLMLQTVAFPHVLFFALGAIQSSFAMLALYQECLFPAPILDVVFPGLAKRIGARFQ